jgi:hypothetical protein
MFLAQKGVWKGAWEHCCLPDLQEQSAGISQAERAGVARHLQEQDKLEEILAKARGNPASTAQALKKKK